MVKKMEAYKKYSLLFVPVALVSILSVSLLPRLDIETADTGTPVSVGIINGININYLVGDVAFPNKEIAGESNSKIVSTRLILWDSYVISSPEPKNTGDGETQIDWTMLPASVVRSIAGIDKPLIGARDFYRLISISYVSVINKIFTIT